MKKSKSTSSPAVKKMIDKIKKAANALEKMLEQLKFMRAKESVKKTPAKKKAAKKAKATKKVAKKSKAKKKK